LRGLPGTQIEAETVRSTRHRDVIDEALAQRHTAMWTPVCQGMQLAVELYNAQRWHIRRSWLEAGESSIRQPVQALGIGDHGRGLQIMHQRLRDGTNAEPGGAAWRCMGLPANVSTP
jgi:hypothetical protein